VGKSHQGSRDQKTSQQNVANAIKQLTYLSDHAAQFTQRQLIDLIIGFSLTTNQKIMNNNDEANNINKYIYLYFDY